MKAVDAVFAAAAGQIEGRPDIERRQGGGIGPFEQAVIGLQALGERAAAGLEVLSSSPQTLPELGPVLPRVVGVEPLGVLGNEERGIRVVFGVSGDTPQPDFLAQRRWRLPEIERLEPLVHPGSGVGFAPAVVVLADREENLVAARVAGQALVAAARSRAAKCA
jgi:hypothetical protein